MEGLILAWTGLLGACVGSFTNVVAWRLPRQESVVFPGSHCPKCGHAIRWHDNLPVLGWLLLGGTAATVMHRSAGVIPPWRPLVPASGSRRCWCGLVLVGGCLISGSPGLVSP